MKRKEVRLKNCFLPGDAQVLFLLGYELHQSDRLLHRMIFLLFVRRTSIEGSHVDCYLELREI